MSALRGLARFARQEESPRERNPPLSQFSSPAVPNSGWCSSNFMLGAGMVLIQRSTGKIVVIEESKRKFWFFPRGRKDVGETLEQAALREAYEESGYRAKFMPVYNPTRAPVAPQDIYREPNTEPVYVTTLAWKDDWERNPERRMGYEYLTSWYIGEIPDDAVREDGTGMADEQNYVGHLLDYKDAMAKLRGIEQKVLQYAWAVFVHTIDMEAQVLEEESRKKARTGSQVQRYDDMME